MRPSRSLVCSALLVIASSAYSGGSPIKSLDTAHANQHATVGSFPTVVEKAYLTVAGNNGYWSRVNYKRGDQPSLPAFDSSGTPLPDGVYRYEYRSAIQASSETGLASKNAMFDNFVSAGNPVKVQKLSGTFRVSNGLIVLAN